MSSDWEGDLNITYRVSGPYAEKNRYEDLLDILASLLHIICLLNYFLSAITLVCWLQYKVCLSTQNTCETIFSKLLFHKV